MTRLALAGIVAILVFATIGQLSHHGGVTLGGYAADTLPFAACWLAVAWGTKRFVPTWLVGVSLGVFVRALVLSHYRWNELAFWLVSLAFVGALAGVLLWIVRRTSVTSFGD